MPRRYVAVAVSATDVVAPDSDLRRVAGAAAEVDVLVVRVDRPGPERLPSPVGALDYPDDDPVDGPGEETVDELLAGVTVPLPATGGARHRLDTDPPANLRMHRLDLRWRIREEDGPDVVAALSELVGFDPEDMVFCVAPVVLPDVDDAEVAVVARAVRRVARVYGLPVLPYHRVSGGTPATVVACPS